MAPAEGAWSPRGRRECLHGHSQRRRSVIGVSHTQGSACDSCLRCSDLGEVACRYRRDFLKSVPFAENEAWIYPHAGLELLTPLTYRQTFIISYLKCPNHLRGLQWAPRSSSMKMQEWKAWLVSEGWLHRGSDGERLTRDETSVMLPFRMVMDAVWKILASFQTEGVISGHLF